MNYYYYCLVKDVDPQLYKLIKGHIKVQRGKCFKKEKLQNGCD